MSNAVEYTLGTDPRGFSPQPLAVAADASNFTLSFLARRASGAGYAERTRKYTVEGTSDLATPSAWQPLTGFTDIVGDDQPVVVTLPMTESSKYYRLNVRLE